MIAETRKSPQLLAHLEKEGAYDNDDSMSVEEAYIAILGSDSTDPDGKRSNFSDQDIISIFGVRVSISIHGFTLIDNCFADKIIN